MTGNDHQTETSHVDTDGHHVGGQEDVDLATLRLLGDASYLKVFEPDRLQALARVQLAGSFDDYYVGLPFFGLAATVCAWLWLKSNYIPRGLSIFGVIASAWCVFCAVVYLIFPNFNKIVNDYVFDSPMAIFELVLSLWLLFKGLKAGDNSETNGIGEGSSKSFRLPILF